MHQKLISKILTLSSSLFHHSETKWCQINMVMYFTFYEILLLKYKTIFTSSSATQVAK